MDQLTAKNDVEVVRTIAELQRIGFKVSICNDDKLISVHPDQSRFLFKRVDIERVTRAYTTLAECKAYADGFMACVSQLKRILESGNKTEKRNSSAIR